MTKIVLRNHPNTRGRMTYSCALCYGQTGQQSYHFVLPDPDGRIVCDECAEKPESINEKMLKAAATLRAQAEWLAATANNTQYATEVVRIPVQWVPGPSGGYTIYADVEDKFPNWMRERVGLPEFNPKEF
jgi:hypothetical protein